jgi:hypothetical protein
MAARSESVALGRTILGHLGEVSSPARGDARPTGSAIQGAVSPGQSNLVKSIVRVPSPKWLAALSIIDPGTAVQPNGGGPPESLSDTGRMRAPPPGAPISDRLTASLRGSTVRFLSSASVARTRKAGRRPALRPIPNRQARGAAFRRPIHRPETAGRSNRLQTLVRCCARGRARSGSVPMRPQTASAPKIP